MEKRAIPYVHHLDATRTFDLAASAQQVARVSLGMRAAFERSATYDTPRTATPSDQEGSAIAGRFEAGTEMDGKTGTVLAQEDGRILRRLSCSEVSDGRLQSLDDSTSATAY